MQQRDVQKKIEDKPLEDKPPSVVTDARRDLLAKNTKGEGGIIGSHPRGSHNVFTHHPKDPCCEGCTMTKINAWTQKHFDHARRFYELDSEISDENKRDGPVYTVFYLLQQKQKIIYTDRSKPFT